MTTTWIVTTQIVTQVEADGPGEAMEIARATILAQLPGASIAHQKSFHVTLDRTRPVRRRT